MKWLFIGLGAALAAAGIVGGIAAVHSRAARKNTDDVDGGVVRRYWNDAPKEIKSDAVVSFHCVISLFSVCDAEDLGHRVYTLDAAVCDGAAAVKYDWYERDGTDGGAEYIADVGFMARLHQIIAEYSLAQHNGYYHSVSGLPAMYGASLEVVYESGEQISVYDNQDCFISVEAARALIMLFMSNEKIP